MSHFVRNFGIEGILLLVLATVLLGIARLAGTVSATPRVAASQTQRTPARIVYAVADTGYGIPAEHLSRLTERFYRISSSRSCATGGTGLGLSIVRHVLNLHGAPLWIESEAGKGSTFACVFDKARLLEAE